MAATGIKTAQPARLEDLGYKSLARAQQSLQGWHRRPQLAHSAHPQLHSP